MEARNLLIVSRLISRRSRTNLKKFLNYFNIFQWKFVICEKKYLFILRSILEFYWLRNFLMIQIFLYLSGCLILEKYLYNVTRKTCQLSFSIVCITFPSVQWALREITTRWSTNNTREVSKNNSEFVFLR